jgi:hypothetical protein
VKDSDSLCEKKPVIFNLPSVLILLRLNRVAAGIGLSTGKG